MPEIWTGKGVRTLGHTTLYYCNVDYLYWCSVVVNGPSKYIFSIYLLFPIRNFTFQNFFFQT